MVRLARPASLIRAAAQHAERVYAVAQGEAPVPAIEELASSWQRSTKRHGVDPVDSRPPRILTAGELKDSREPLGKLISTAQEELDRLYKVVREAGYTILFCDSVRGSRSSIAASRRRRATSNTGEPGSAASGPRRSRAPTASAPASPRSGP
jgi:transcriptional regulator of acetoin/glycerol metabolism